MGWPIERGSKLTANGKTITETTKLNEDDISTFTFNMLMGPALRPVNTDKLLLIVVPGIDVNVTTTTYKYGNKTVKEEFISSGVAANARFGYKVTQNVVIDAGLTLGYNFVSTLTVDGEKDDNMDDKLQPAIITPKIGATFLF